MNVFLQPAIYLTSYLVAILLTYILPYWGSNAWSLKQVAHATNSDTSSFAIFFTIHLVVYLFMGVLTAIAGKNTNKMWLVGFPIMAGIFDLAPTLNLIPLIPSILNIVALVISFKAITQYTSTRTLA